MAVTSSLVNGNVGECVTLIPDNPSAGLSVIHFRLTHQLKKAFRRSCVFALVSAAPGQVARNFDRVSRVTEVSRWSFCSRQ